MTNNFVIGQYVKYHGSYFLVSMIEKDWLEIISIEDKQKVEYVHFSQLLPVSIIFGQNTAIVREFV